MGNAVLTFNVFLCVVMENIQKKTNTRSYANTTTVAANIKSGFIKFSVDFVYFAVNAPRENFENRKWKCKTAKDEANEKKNIVLNFSFGFPIQLYGFVWPKKIYYKNTSSIHSLKNLFSGYIFLTMFFFLSRFSTMASYDLWLCAVNKKQEARRRRRKKRSVEKDICLVYEPFWFYCVFFW